MLSDARPDRSGGVNYQQFDRVRIEKTWKDRLHKEKELRQAAHDAGAVGGFQMNLANTCANGGFLSLKYSHNRMETVTEKEIKQSPQQRSSSKGMDPHGMEMTAIKHLDKRPTQKWDMPATTSQDNGWFCANPVRAESMLLPASAVQELARCRSAAGLEGAVGRTPPMAIPAMSLTTPANDRVLARSRSAPSLPQGPLLPEVRMLNNRKWYRPKGLCDVTTYAEAYITMNQSSPFAAGRG